MAFVGEMATGKGLAAQYLITKHNAGSYRFSNMLRDIANRLYLPISRDILIRVSEIIRENFGEDVMAKVMAKEVGEDTSELIIVDGVRRIADIEHLKQLEGFHLVHITASLDTRFNRIIQRGENEGETKLTREQFEDDCNRSTEISIREVAKHANFTIENEGGIEELQDKLEDLLTKLSSYGG